MKEDSVEMSRALVALVEENKRENQHQLRLGQPRIIKTI